MKMQAVHEISKEMSLNKALQYCGMSKHASGIMPKNQEMF